MPPMIGEVHEDVDLDGRKPERILPVEDHVRDDGIPRIHQRLRPLSLVSSELLLLFVLCGRFHDEATIRFFCGGRNGAAWSLMSWRPGRKRPCGGYAPVLRNRTTDKQHSTQVRRTAANSGRSLVSGRFRQGACGSPPLELPKEIRFGDHPPSPLLKPSLHREVSECRTGDVVLSPKTLVPRGSHALPQVMLRQVEEGRYLFQRVTSEPASHLRRNGLIALVADDRRVPENRVLDNAAMTFRKGQITRTQLWVDGAMNGQRCGFSRILSGYFGDRAPVSI